MRTLPKTAASRWAVAAAALALLLGLPLAGAQLAAPAPAAHPSSAHPLQAPLFWPSVAGVIAAAAFVCGRRTARPQACRRAPPWFWAAVIGLPLAWALAWTRADWAQPLQPVKFPLLWLSYIALVNAWTCARSGRCLLRDRPLRLAVLFPCSAAVWWYFEYLNRFVRNWHYHGTEDYGPLAYMLYATLSFSTVLPAIASTMELLRTLPPLARTRSGPAVAVTRPRALAGLALGIGGLGLLGIGADPRDFFPLVWVAPVLLILGLQTLSGARSYLAPLARGGWDIVLVPACAALVCGLFWELWNYYSWPKWTYTVPYVQRFEIFEMPLLGYAGYLPFGVGCAVIIDLVGRWRRLRLMLSRRLG